jgi:transcriptional regulator with XRE-family HTH domain
MKKLQCTQCDQVFWTDLTEVDEANVGEGEWIKASCPKCDSEWVMAAFATSARPQPQGKSRPAGRRERPPATTERKRGKRAAREGTGFRSSSLRALRKKLGFSQRELAVLMGVSTNSVTAWEGGKAKPREEKAARLADLEKMGEEEARAMLNRNRKSEQPRKNTSKNAVRKPRRRKAKDEADLSE